MAATLRPRTAILVLVVVLAVGVISSSAVSLIANDATYDHEADFVPIYEGDNGDQTELWPYTSHSTRFEHRTLAINLIVYGDPAITKWYLTDLGRGDWNVTVEDEQDVAPAEISVDGNATTTPWRPADGADRYIYVRHADGNGRWLAENYQLHDGDYLGTRQHLRAYSSIDYDQPWTAFQAHREHWDWFHLRHTVDSTEGAQRYVEQEFMGRAIVDSLYRTHVGNDYGSDSTGWVTVIEFHPVEVPLRDQTTPSSVVVPALVFGVVGVRWLESVRDRHLDWLPVMWLQMGALVVAIVGLLLFVRFGAIAAERFLPISAKMIAIPFYPLIFVGIPVATYLLARQLDRAHAFAGASIGFITAILLDYTYLGVTVIPLDVLVHRGALAVALGLIASGASYTVRRDPELESHIQMGVLLWLVAMILPLLRYLPLPV